MSFDTADRALTKALNRIAELESQLAAEKARADKAESAVAFAARGRLGLSPPEAITFDDKSTRTVFPFPVDGRQKGWRYEMLQGRVALVSYDWLTMVMEDSVCVFNDKGTFAVHDGFVSGRLRQIRFGR